MIIGGYFGLNPWQRGTSFAGVADGTYTADRFVYNKVGTMVHTISKDNDVPILVYPLPSGEFDEIASLYVDCTTADAAIAALIYALLVIKLKDLIIFGMYKNHL